VSVYFFTLCAPLQYHTITTKIMKNIIIIILTLGSLFANAQTSSTNSSKAKKVSTEVDFKLETEQVFDKLVKIRRVLHQNPELAGEEKQTQETIKQYLLELGLEVKTDIYGYGIVGILKGAKKGKSIAWRADMDALPNDFPDNVDFKSNTKGVQHGCGHDVHMTIALGIAEVLAKNKKDLQGIVYFIFQPQEESFTGAKGMVENKIFSKINPSEIYGLHITPFPVGQIMVKANEMYAYQKGVQIQFKNNVSKESLAELASKIRSTLTRTTNNSKPWEIQHALDPNDGLANPNTIFKDYFMIDENHIVNYSENDTLFLEFDVYETDKDKLVNIIPAIKEVIESQNLSAQLLSITIIKENPTINNDPKLTTIAINTLDEMFGKGSVTVDYGQVPFSNDDFSYFQQKIPGVYFFLGGSNFEKGMIAMIHAPNFMVDEECIRIGVKSFASLLLERLKNK
jgi:metal-dependent amidase/aminoacylase/carboxypeptidase family protein